MTPLRVLVTDAGRGSALATIRSLGRAGHFVIATDASPNPAGGRSRYTAARGHYPSPFTTSTQATAQGIAELARRHRADVVVPVTDDTIVPLVSHQPQLPTGCVLATASPSSLDLAASKVATWAVATRLGVAQPESVLLLDPEDASGVVAGLGLPVVVKPDRSRMIGPDGRLVKGTVSYAWSDEEVAAAIRRAGQPVLVQSYRPGAGYGIGIVARDGEPLLAVAHRRLHEVPISGGASARRETVAAEGPMLSDAVAMLRAMKWTGAAMVEFKGGPEGFALMEVNGRLWGSLPLAVRAGSDVPGRMLAVHMNGHRSCDLDGDVDTDYRRGVVARNLDLELVWIGSVLARGGSASSLVEINRRDGVAAIGDLFRRNQGDDLVARDDLRPVLTGVRNAVSHAVHKVFSRG